MTFEFATAGRILFGEGVVGQVGALATELGIRILVVGGGTPARVESLLALLADEQLPVSTISVVGEPTVAETLKGTEQARDFGADLVIGMGGGSVIDAAKAIAALLTNPGDPVDYLEVIGHGRPLANPAAAHRNPHHCGYRCRGNAQRRARGARTGGQGEYAPPLPVARSRARRSRIDPMPCRRRLRPAPDWMP